MKDQRTGGLGGTRKRQRYAAATNRLKICVSTYCRTLDIFLPWTTLKKSVPRFLYFRFSFFPSKSVPFPQFYVAVLDDTSATTTTTTAAVNVAANIATTSIDIISTATTMHVHADDNYSIAS